MNMAYPDKDLYGQVIVKRSVIYHAIVERKNDQWSPVSRVQQQDQCVKHHTACGLYRHLCFKHDDEWRVASEIPDANKCQRCLTTLALGEDYDHG